MAKNKRPTSHVTPGDSSAETFTWGAPPKPSDNGAFYKREILRLAIQVAVEVQDFETASAIRRLHDGIGVCPKDRLVGAIVVAMNLEPSVANKLSKGLKGAKRVTDCLKDVARRKGKAKK